MTRKTFIAVLLVLLSSAAVAISAADSSILNRAQLATVETTVDQRLMRLWSDNSLSVVGPPRAVHLPGVGLVVTVEVALAVAPVGLMVPSLTDKDKAALLKKKTDRLPILRNTMREVMATLATSLSQVPATEQIFLSVILPRYPWEDSAALPMQIMMQGSKQDLVAAKSAGGSALDKAVVATESK